MSTYFKKANPNGAVYVNGGRQKVTFEALDASTGFFEAKSEALATELQEAIKKGIGGMTEITKAEFDGMVQKKTVNPSSRIWREEITKGGLSHIAVPLPPAAVPPVPVAAAASSPPTPADTEEAKPKVRSHKKHE